MDRLTKLLKASIQKETNTMNKLNDFPAPVLKAMLGACAFKSNTLKEHIAKIESYGSDMKRLMARELYGFTVELEALDTAEIQISTALIMIQEQERVNQN